MHFYIVVVVVGNVLLLHFLLLFRSPGYLPGSLVVVEWCSC
jgi:hypothetical protein